MLEGPARQPPGARHRHRHGQGPVRRGDRGVLRQPGPGPGPDPPGPQGREDTPVLPELAAAAGRGDHLDAEEPARPRTPRRPRPRRAVGPHRPAAAGPQRLHLAQLADRRTGQALPDRLRPLSCPYFPVNDLEGRCHAVQAGRTRLLRHHRSRRTRTHRHPELRVRPAPYALSSVLTCRDMTTSPDGEPVPVDRRLAEIHDRYGPGHLVSRSSCAPRR